eukprot:TRINITY_DN633_c0_g1_i3.p1 TRINITY_DN633_c0_g1~~TRINITY_DN633_c0_g1_i3.p1  ORF type:complete len:518 (+),score=55.40 TRINITY_DN633_c0_g1_i3:116-1669(+)
MRFSIVLISLSLFVGLSHQWDPFGIGRSISNEITKAGEHLEDHARDVFLEAANELVTNDIEPLLHNMEAMALKAMDHLRDDLEQLGKSLRNDVIKVIDDIAQKVYALVEKTKEAIEEVFAAAASTINDIVNNFFVKAQSLLNSIDKDIHNWICSAQGAGSNFLQELEKLVPKFVWPWDKCRIRLDKEMPDRHLRTTPVVDMTLPTQLKYGECKALIDLKPSDPVASYCDAFEKIAELSAAGRCQAIAIGVEPNFFLNMLGSTYASQVALDCMRTAQATVTVKAPDASAGTADPTTSCDKDDSMPVCMVKLFKALQDLSDNFNEGLSQISGFQGDIDTFKSSLNTVKSSVVALGKDNDALKAGIAKVSTRVNASTASIAKVGTQVKTIASHLSIRGVDSATATSLPIAVSQTVVLQYTIPKGITPTEVGVNCFSQSGNNLNEVPVTTYKVFTKNKGETWSSENFSIAHWSQGAISYDNVVIWLAMADSGDDQNVYVELTSGPNSGPHWGATCSVTHYR